METFHIFLMKIPRVTKGFRGKYAFKAMNLPKDIKTSERRSGGRSHKFDGSCKPFDWNVLTYYHGHCAMRHVGKMNYDGSPDLSSSPHSDRSPWRSEFGIKPKRSGRNQLMMLLSGACGSREQQPMYKSYKTITGDQYYSQRSQKRAGTTLNVFKGDGDHGKDSNNGCMQEGFVRWGP